MRRNKERLTVTVDRELIEAGHAAVASGRAASLSSWVNAALVERAQKERRVRAMADAVATFEAEHGIITAEEIAAQERSDRGTAVVVRPKRRRRKRGSGAA